MSKMKELSMAIEELRRCGEALIDVADSLKATFSSDSAEAPRKTEAPAPKPVPLALNDLAEVLRRNKNFDDAELYARKAVKAAPRIYTGMLVARETNRQPRPMPNVLMIRKGRRP